MSSWSEREQGDDPEEVDVPAAGSVTLEDVQRAGPGQLGAAHTFPCFQKPSMCNSEWVGKPQCKIKAQAKLYSDSIFPHRTLKTIMWLHNFFFF